MSRDTEHWAKPMKTLRVGEVPAGALSLNVAGRRLVGPVQGFGQMWQKTYRVRLDGISASVADLVRTWKAELPQYQPKQNRFFPSVAGVAPGEVVLIKASIQGMPVATAVVVLYSDDESFTLATPQGHPESGWVTFSAYQEDGAVVAQVQSIARANDPIYEFGFRFMGGSKAQEAIWRHVVTALANRYGVSSEVTLTKTCVDPRLQWSQAGNVWHNAIIRTTLYWLATPLRLLARLVPGRRGTA